MINIGKAIVAARKAKGLKQFELARRAEMAAAQLCQIENGRISPSFYSVERIAEALDTDIPCLLYGMKGPAKSQAEDQDSRAVGNARSLIAIRLAEPDEARALQAIEKNLASASLRPSSPCTLAFNKAHAQYEGAGVALAEELRAELGLGTAPVGDLSATLSYRGVRILEARFAKRVGSVSFWDRQNAAPAIVLNARSTAERKLYRLVYELGSVALYRSTGVRLDESLIQHRFLTDFAAAFLMPGVTVRTCVASQGISPDAWDLSDILPLKSYFGVSAEAFILRMEELGLIVPKLRLSLRDMLRAYYKKHPDAMEPQAKGGRI